MSLLDSNIVNIAESQVVLNKLFNWDELSENWNSPGYQYSGYQCFSMLTLCKESPTGITEDIGDRFNCYYHKSIPEMSWKSIKYSKWHDELYADIDSSNVIISRRYGTCL